MAIVSKTTSFILLLSSCCSINTLSSSFVIGGSRISSSSTITSATATAFTAIKPNSKRYTPQTVLFSSSGEGEEIEHPSDEASTTPQLLKALWSQISDGCTNLSKGVS